MDQTDMHDDNTLPALRPTVTELPFEEKDPTEAVRPGAWWRLVDPAHAFASRPRSAETLVLMVQEARRVDGELHTVVLRAHPLWKPFTEESRGLKMLADDFLGSFQPAGDGDAVRAAEAGAAMERVQAAMAAMAAIPNDEPTLLALSDARREAAAKKARRGSRDDKKDSAAEDKTRTGADGAEKPAVLLPAVLLPSRDVAAAQDKAQRQIALLEGRQAWIEDRGAEMKEAMGLVSAYQDEKVALTMATVSEAQAHANTLLAKVTTLRLFTGEDIDVKTLVEGEGADPAEPLVFMQRLLYLDDEIFVHGLDEEMGLDLSDGLNADHLGALPDILRTHPELVSRMLPFQRCVVLARIRRERRQHSELSESMAGAIRQIFEQIAQEEADRRVLVLVRDGGKLHMVLADEQTSRAERLFPSQAEIQKLFSRRTRRGEVASSITPDDLDYTDARVQHDSRALHYKRFLIMFWGLHEREGLFGPFMPGGENWLLSSTHDARFRFLHDEENALEDGRGSIRDWIRGRNSGVAAGSRVVGQWGLAACSSRAPSLRKHERDRDTVLATPEMAASMEIVRQDAGELVVDVPSVKEVWSRTQRDFTDKKFRARFTLVGKGGSWITQMPEESLCLDTVTATELDSWIAHRGARAIYKTWILGFAHARKVLREEEAALRARFEAAPDGAGVTWEAFLKASLTWRRAKRWAMPKTARDTAAIMAVARALNAAKEEDDKTLWVTVDAKARIQRWAPVDARDEGHPVASAWARNLDEAAETRLVFAPTDPTALPGCVRTPDTWAEWRKTLLEQTPAGMRTPEDLEALRAVGTPERIARLDALASGDKAAIRALLEEAFTVAHKISRNHVRLPVFEATLAAGLVEDGEQRRPLGDTLGDTLGDPLGDPLGDRGHGQRNDSAVLIVGITACPLEIALHAGMETEVMALAQGLYNQPQAAINRLKKHLEDRGPLRLGLVYGIARDDLPGWAKRGWLNEDARLSRLGGTGVGASGAERLRDRLRAKAEDWPRRPGGAKITLWTSPEAETLLDRLA